jgi:hypothetical protein
MVTIVNTGNVDFFDLDVDLGGGGGGNFSLITCTSNGTGDVSSFLPATLLVATQVVCYLQYTVVQEDLEVGFALLNTTANSASLSGPSVSGPVNVSADQDVSVLAEEFVMVTAANPNNYSAIGEDA